MKFLPCLFLINYLKFALAHNPPILLLYLARIYSECGKMMIGIFCAMQRRKRQNIFWYRHRNNQIKKTKDEGSAVLALSTCLRPPIQKGSPGFIKNHSIQIVPNIFFY